MSKYSSNGLWLDTDPLMAIIEADKKASEERYGKSFYTCIGCWGKHHESELKRGKCEKCRT